MLSDKFTYIGSLAVNDQYKSDTTEMLLFLRDHTGIDNRILITFGSLYWNGITNTL